jgi:electron transfer flavoprotein alpha subunit
MVFVFAEKEEGVFKKSTLEAVTYGRDFADALGVQCSAVVLGTEGDVSELSKSGAQEVVQVAVENENVFSPDVFAKGMVEAMKDQSPKAVIISGTYSGKSLAPKVAVQLKGGLVTGVTEMASTENGISVKKTCFSNKAYAHVKVHGNTAVLGTVPNSYEVKEFSGEAAVKQITLDAVAKSTSVEVDKVKGKVPLTEAEIVVSAGRGLKGPENWGMVEELADLLGAATACSKPVSDMEWRPHAEHVGQTGITIKPNLYIAIGISGAIQHLAGVGSSKVICVVNTDPEAPFFKAADYGIVGDAFEVVPKLIEKAKAMTAG